MNITFYKNNSPNNYLTKQLAGAVNMTGELRNESSVIDPVILIEYSNLSKFNYLYIPDFLRFYFIRNIESIRTNIWAVHCHVDVLNTYRSEIKLHQAIISKTANYDDADLIIDDGDWVCENRMFNTIIEFPKGLNEHGTNILITAGWAGN